MFSAVARLGPVGAAFLVKAYASPCKGESGIGKSEVGDAPTPPPPGQIYSVYAEFRGCATLIGVVLRCGVVERYRR